jgi:hypothetical protein
MQTDDELRVLALKMRLGLKVQFRYSLPEYSPWDNIGDAWYDAEYDTTFNMLEQLKIWRDQGLHFRVKPRAD